jgi:acetylornithine deacetylase/succinyl-diaminopimelate desuccinylase-like protein
MITEGDEESGSGHIGPYIKKLQERIGNPSIFFCLDSGAIDYQRMWITNSLRGVVAGKLKVEVLSEGVHSGDASGIVPSSFRILRKLLDRL